MIAHKHVQAITSVPGAKLVAVLSSNAYKAASFAAQYGSTPCTDFDAFLADNN